MNKGLRLDLQCAITALSNLNFDLALSLLQDWQEAGGGTISAEETALLDELIRLIAQNQKGAQVSGEFDDELSRIQRKLDSLAS